MTHSYSDMLTYLRCPKKYEYAVVRQLQRKATAVNLALGILFHQLLMGHYLGTYDEVWEELSARIMDAPLIDDEVLEYEDLLNQAAIMVDRYLAYYEGDSTWEILAVETQYTITLDSGEQISFTPDLVIRDDRGVWVVDHKTTNSLPKGDLPVGNFQAFLYSAAMREIYPDFRGFIFNFVRKKLPAQPRLTKTGGKKVADVGRIDTTYEILRDFILAEAPELMDDPTHRRRLAELKDNNRFFWRQYVFTTDEISDAILDEAVNIIQHIDLSTETGVFPRHFLPYAGAQECSNCPFADLCVAELRGYDTETIMYMYEPRDLSHKNYEHEEEVLL